MELMDLAISGVSLSMNNRPMVIKKGEMLTLSAFHSLPNSSKMSFVLCANVLWHAIISAVATKYFFMVLFCFKSSFIKFVVKRFHWNRRVMWQCCYKKSEEIFSEK
jgi:hypothetical protein